MQTYSNIDDILGPSQQRYFATRWKMTTDSMGPLTYDPEKKRLSGTFEVSYPKDWSIKPGRGELEPHLSGLDVMRISGQYVQAFCFLYDGIERPESNNIWLLEFEMVPYHKILNFADIPVEMELIYDKQWSHRKTGNIWHEFHFGLSIGNGAFICNLKVAYEMPQRMQEIHISTNNIHERELASITLSK